MLTRRRFLNLAAAGATYASVVPAQVKPALAAARGDELIGYDALGLAELIRTKEITPAELLEVVVGRIEALNPVLNFMATPMFDRARATAQEVAPDALFCGGADAGKRHD